MLKTYEQRPHCASVRTKRSQSAPLEESQNEGKQYRTLLSLFANNINSLLKLHRDCLGEIDCYPKIKASREEHQALAEQLEKIYLKMEDKLLKDPNVRNSNIRKSIEDYTDHFKAAFPSWKQAKSTEAEAKNQQIEGEDISPKNYLSQRKQATINPTPRRPLSSKESKQAKSHLFHQIYQNFQSNQFSQTYKIKTISAHANENPESKKAKDFIMTNHLKLSKIPSRAKKSLVNHKHRYQDIKSQKQKDYQEFLFNGEEIMINERKCNKNPNEYESQEQNSPYSSKHSAKRMINLKFTQRKSINQIEKMQIQNRIMLINSVLSVNLVQPQGYRPKSRCWQNYFN